MSRDISSIWSSLNAVVNALFKEESIRAGFTVFGNDVEVWFIFWTWNAVVVFNKWSCFWTWLFSSVHVFIQSTFFSFIRDQNVWLTSDIWFVVFRSSLFAWMSGTVINCSVRANITFSCGNVENWSWIAAWNTCESIPEWSAWTTVGKIVVVVDSVDVIFWDIFHGHTSKNPRLLGIDVCLIWGWTN